LNSEPLVLSVPRIATLATAAVTRVNHVLETASSPDFFSSLLNYDIARHHENELRKLSIATARFVRGHVKR
ncbi:hypothetical protein, partial [Marivita sp.]|uniref:hypothetical protein n=1 Tax=Marivita sp. TaxID=2003365 RepID=UPI003F6C2870